MRFQEHAIEPVRGLPARLPPGESLLWQSGPAWKSYALRGTHLGWLMAYFAAMVLWYGAHAMSTRPAGAAVVATLQMAAVACVAVGLVGGFAWAVGRSTVYSITSRRLVMRVGIALPITIALPFACIAAADVKIFADGTGNILLTLKPEARAAYFLLWPHVRPWRLRRPQPLLRSVPDIAVVAPILARALAAAAVQPVTAIVAGADAGLRQPDAVLA